MKTSIGIYGIVSSRRFRIW